MTKECNKVLVIPCSGIGKVHGLISRKSAYLGTDELAPARPTWCGPVGEARRRDACRGAGAPLHHHRWLRKGLCAQKNVEIAGGEVAKAFQVARTLSAHRGAEPGSGSELTGDGWAITREIAEAAAEEAARICAGEETA